MQFTIYSDPGHAWLCVPLEMLDWLKLLDRITRYSYIKGGNAYLEEDLDMSQFLEACNAAGISFTFRERCAQGYSRIRNYMHFAPDIARQNIANGREWKPAWKPPRSTCAPAEAAL